MIITQTISTTEIYLAAALQSGRDENGLFVQICIADSERFDRFDAFKTRLIVPRDDDGSQRALRHALNYVSPSENTILHYTLPYPIALSDADANLYPRLTMEAVKRTENPAWSRLLAYVSRLKAI
jgi:hypothetical protein